MKLWSQDTGEVSTTRGRQEFAIAQIVPTAICGGHIRFRGTSTDYRNRRQPTVTDVGSLGTDTAAAGSRRCR